MATLTETEVRFDRDEPKNVDAGLIKHPFGPWEIDAVVGGERRMTPVYNLRDEKDKVTIAHLIARGDEFVFHGWGVEGVAQFAPNRRGGQLAKELVFNKGKSAENRDRGNTKVPILAPPRMLMKILDPRVIHPDMRELFTDRRLFEARYDAATAHHELLPIRQTTLHPEVFQSAEDWHSDKNYRDKPEFWVPHPTISAMWMPDPDFDDIANMVELLNDNGVIACSSMNLSGQLPKWSTEELPSFILQNKRFLPAKFVIRDSRAEVIDASAESSHPQFRPAFVGEQPGWWLYRRGALEADDFARLGGGGFPVRTPGNVPVDAIKLASRSERHQGVSLSQRHFDLRDAIKDDYELRRPKSKKVIFLGDIFSGGRLRNAS